MNKIDWTKVKHDVNGNPRYVCHFLNFLSQKEQTDFHKYNYGIGMYNFAIKRANKLGGRKYHTKGYGGGIVFQSYNLQDTEKAILELVERESC